MNGRSKVFTNIKINRNHGYSVRLEVGPWMQRKVATSFWWSCLQIVEWLIWEHVQVWVGETFIICLSNVLSQLCNQVRRTRPFRSAKAISLYLRNDRQAILNDHWLKWWSFLTYVLLIICFTALFQLGNFCLWSRVVCYCMLIPIITSRLLSWRVRRRVTWVQRTACEKQLLIC